MDYFLLLTSGLLLIAGMILFWLFRTQQRALENALKRLTLLDPEGYDGHTPELVLTVRVLDPIAVAKKESRSARVVADRLPFMVRKMVYDQVMKEMGAELNERGIDVEMNVEYR